MWDTWQRCPGQGASPGAERALGGHGEGGDRRVSTLVHSGKLQKLSKGPLSSLSRVCEFLWLLQPCPRVSAWV